MRLRPEESFHKCDACGKDFTYPAESRPWGLPSNESRILRPRWQRMLFSLLWWRSPAWKTCKITVRKGAPCCPCYDCDPEAFRESLGIEP